MRIFNFYQVSAAALLLSSSHMMADDKNDQSTNTPLAAGFTAPCRTEVQGCWDVFISGSFTFWQPIQENMSLGVVSDNSAADDLVNGYQEDLNYHFKPGFKVALGMNFDYDAWDSMIEYTWFRGTETTSVVLDANNDFQALLPYWQIPSFLDPEYSSGSESWRLAMDLIDWDLARSCMLGEQFCVRPFMGMRAAFMRQKLNVSYINETASDISTWPSTYIYQTARSWAIGPRWGLFSNWQLGAGCRLYGKGELDVLYTQYDVRFRQNSATDDPSYFIIKNNNINSLRAHSELALGFGWGTYFADDAWHIDLAADYGFQVFWSQNMFRSFATAQAVGTNTFPTGNLYIQGLTFTARLDF